jgi:GT2 family glycosyltransferase
MIDQPAMAASITVSLVSHGHGAMVQTIVAQLLRLPDVAKIFLTLNIPEQLTIHEDLRVIIIHNQAPKGFGANHNAAFLQCATSHFCVINPDVTLQSDVFPQLLACLHQTDAALVAPLVCSPSGALEDSMRTFPTLGGLIRKALGHGDGTYAPAQCSVTFSPDWVAGMFMLFDSQAFAALRGFDEGFFLYYEDVDICARVWAAGNKVVACTDVRVIHDAQRASRRKLQYMFWHAKSLLRYLLKHVGRIR